VNATEAKPARRTRRQWSVLEAELAAVRAKLEAAESEVTRLADTLYDERKEHRMVDRGLDEALCTIDILRAEAARMNTERGPCGSAVAIGAAVAAWVSR